jgi:hypothetical protein
MKLRLDASVLAQLPEKAGLIGRYRSKGSFKNFKYLGFGKIHRYVFEGLFLLDYWRFTLLLLEKGQVSIELIRRVSYMSLVFSIVPRTTVWNCMSNGWGIFA